MKRVVIFIFAVLVAGCAYNITLMGRESGQTYAGEMVGSGGSGTMTVHMGNNTCSGPVARVASNQTFGFSSTYATNNRGQSVNAFTNTATAGDSQVKGILSCTNGSGLRCDMTGRGATGGGICVDDAGKVYDAIAIRK